MTAGILVRISLSRLRDEASTMIGISSALAIHIAVGLLRRQHLCRRNRNKADASCLAAGHRLGARGNRGAQLACAMRSLNARALST